MPKTTPASVLFGVVTFAAAIALTAIEWVDDRPASERLRLLVRLACAVVVLGCCASSATAQAATHQLTTTSTHQEHINV